MWKFIKPGLLVGGLWLVAIVFLGGCVGSVELASGHRIALNSKEFEDYVERIFKYQNKVADELAFALVDMDAAQPSYGALESAEAQLLIACSGLNELATARRDDLQLSIRRKLELARQVPNCEQAADVASAALRAASV